MKLKQNKRFIRLLLCHLDLFPFLSTAELSKQRVYDSLVFFFSSAKAKYYKSSSALLFFFFTVSGRVFIFRSHNEEKLLKTFDTDITYSEKQKKAANHLINDLCEWLTARKLEDIANRQNLLRPPKESVEESVRLRY